MSWNGLTSSDGTGEPIEGTYEDVPQMLERLLIRKKYPRHLAAKARAFWLLDRGECNRPSGSASVRVSL